MSAVGTEWRSRAGGKIDRRITLDIAVTPQGDGGPVLDASGQLLGISTLGYRDTVLAIPPQTVERSVSALLAHGHGGEQVDLAGALDAPVDGLAGPRLACAGMPTPPSAGLTRPMSASGR